MGAILIYYHGTSYEAMLSIIQNGFNAPDTIWGASDMNDTYVISAEPEERQSENLEFAIYVGTTAAAKIGSNYPDIAIIRLEFDEYADLELIEDALPYCYSISSSLLNDLIEEGHVKLSIGIMENVYNQYLRPHYLTKLDTRLFDDPVLIDAIDAIKSTEQDINVHDRYAPASSFEELKQYTVCKKAS